MALNKKCFDLDIEIECVLKLGARPNKALLDLSARLHFYFVPLSPHSSSMSPPPFLSLRLPLASLLACLSLPSPVTLEGFNHQLNVTPYLRSADEHSRTHTSACTPLPPCWVVILHFQQLFFFFFFSCKQLERHTRQDGGGCLSHMQTAELCLHKLCSLALLITLIKYGINI